MSQHAPSPLSMQLDPQSLRENIARTGSRYWPPDMNTAFREPSSEAGELSTIIDLDGYGVIDSGALLSIPVPLSTPAPFSIPVPQSPRNGPKSQSQGLEDGHKVLQTRETSSRAVLEVINEASPSTTVPGNPQHEHVDTDARCPTRGPAEISQKTTDVGNWVNKIPSGGNLEGGAENCQSRILDFDASSISRAKQAVFLKGFLLY